jgi:hypothetical protein
MNDKEFMAKLDTLPIEKPDAEDIAMIEMVTKQNVLEKSGRIVLRLPKTLHRELLENAAKEGVSLNQYCLYRLAQR